MPRYRNETVAEELRKLLLNPQFRSILDEHGKPVSPSSKIYADISNMLNNKMTSKYVYTFVQSNRYNLLDELVTFHNIEKQVDVFSLADEKSFSSSNSINTLNFLVKIPWDTWRTLKPEIVHYNSRSSG